MAATYSLTVTVSYVSYPSIITSKDFQAILRDPCIDGFTVDAPDTITVPTYYVGDNLSETAWGTFTMDPSDCAVTM